MRVVQFYLKAQIINTEYVKTDERSHLSIKCTCTETVVERGGGGEASMQTEELCRKTVICFKSRCFEALQQY